MDAHNQKKKKNYRKKKNPGYSDKFLVASTLTPPRQHQKSLVEKGSLAWTL
jgi:hypothetical protein